MDAHRVYVLNGADYDDVICEVAHDFELELFPACDALFDEGAPYGAGVEAIDDGPAKFAVVGGSRAPFAAESEAGTDDEGEADLCCQLLGLVEDARLAEFDGEVEGGLAPQGGEQRVGSLAAQYLGDGFGRQGLDVGCVRDLRVSHYGRRIGVYEDYAVTLVAQGVASLGTRVVELCGLPDHDRSRADDQDARDVVAPGHARLAPSLKYCLQNRRTGSQSP